MSDSKRRNAYRASGFTLIELLVVIAISAVFLGILAPAMRKIKEIARAEVCRSNLNNMGLAVAMSLDDFGRKLPKTGRSNQFLWYTTHRADDDNFLVRWYTADKSAPGGK